jgi:peptide deformylase
MANLDIVTYPDALLRAKAEPVLRVDDEVRKLVDDMAETMYAASGIGLASNQIGVLKQVAVVDVDYPQSKPNLIALLNPEIIEQEGETTTEEGCLSFPDVREKITRNTRVKIRALGRDGQAFELEADGLLGVALQHEIDHLNGVLIIDRVSFLKKRLIHRQMKSKKYFSKKNKKFLVKG